MAFDGKETLILAILTLLLAKFLNSRLGFLRQYNIPEPVTGGVLASALFVALYAVTDKAVFVDLSNHGMLLIIAIPWVLASRSANPAAPWRSNFPS